MKKSGNWCCAEQKVLLSKALEYIKVISSIKKDAASNEKKKKAWEHIAALVNEVNYSGCKRTGQDASAKWQQLKCKANGSLEELKKMLKDLEDG